MRKKLLALVLATTAVLTFAACGDSGNDSKTNSANASTPTSSAQASTPSSPAQSSAPSSSAEEVSATMEDWLAENPSDVKEIEDDMNSQLAAAGFSCKINAEGNVFIYEYYLDALTDASSLTEADQAQLDANFEATVEAQAANISTMFEAFEEVYGIRLDAIRFVFYAGDGTELYTGEVENK